MTELYRNHPVTGQAQVTVGDRTMWVDTDGTEAFGEGEQELQAFLD